MIIEMTIYAKVAIRCQIEFLLAIELSNMRVNDWCG